MGTVGVPNARKKKGSILIIKKELILNRQASKSPKSYNEETDILNFESANCFKRLATENDDDPSPNRNIHDLDSVMPKSMLSLP